MTTLNRKIQDNLLSDIGLKQVEIQELREERNAALTGWKEATNGWYKAEDRIKEIKEQLAAK